MFPRVSLASQVFSKPNVQFSGANSPLTPRPDPAKGEIIKAEIQLKATDEWELAQLAREKGKTFQDYVVGVLTKHIYKQQIKKARREFSPEDLADK